MDTVKKKVLTLMFAVLVIGARVGYFIDTPLWLDFLKHNTTTDQNSTDIRQISVYFLLVTQWGFVALVTGILLLVVTFRCDGYIGETERQFPKKYFLLIGSSMGMSSVLFNYSVSGSRTPPYLQAILGNCNIPIQFVTRFLLLRKRPTVIKLLCAVVIVVAELVCLLPTIFPSLEPHSAHVDEGGATGAGRILWPICMVSSMIPFAISNTLTERSVQQAKLSTGMANPSQLNLLYFQFWWSFFVFLTATACFWTDILPGFGTSDSWAEFADKFWFDLQCLFGVASCPPIVVILGWANYVISTVAGYALPALMRYSEGANFVVIILTLRTPLVFLFWSLFNESPFHWHPHLHLSTWLSIAAISVMLPAVICYDMGDVWLSKFRQRGKEVSEERSTLIPGHHSVQQTDTDYRPEVSEQRSGLLPGQQTDTDYRPEVSEERSGLIPVQQTDTDYRPEVSVERSGLIPVQQTDTDYRPEVSEEGSGLIPGQPKVQQSNTDYRSEVGEEHRQSNTPTT